MQLNPKIVEMASGGLSLHIVDYARWDAFPEMAKQFVSWSGGYVLKRIDTPVERMWIVLIRWRPFFLTYDDFEDVISLDSMFPLCNPVIFQLHQQMLDSFLVGSYNEMIF